MPKIETYFASAEKLNQGDIYLQTIKVLGLRQVIDILNLLPSMIVILNMERQIIFSNDAFIQELQTKKFEEGLGMRPGDLFECVNSHDTENGCGTGRECKYCGLVLTVLKSQETGVKQEKKEASIVVNQNGKFITLTFHIIVSPILIDNEIFYIVILTKLSSSAKE